MKCLTRKLEKTWKCYAGLNKHNVFRNVAVQLILFLPENLALAEIFGSAAWNYHLTMPDWKIDRQKKTRRSCWKGNEETDQIDPRSMGGATCFTQWNFSATAPDA